MTTRRGALIQLSAYFIALLVLGGICWLAWGLIR